VKGYRPDIDGLRALAVAAVLAFHGYPAVVPGGFMGVDVFFVISGYLITGLIERDLRQGRFSMLDFYRGRVRRIVPALLAVLAFCCLVSWYVLTPIELAWFGKSNAWSAVFLGNAFSASLGGYFDDWVYPNPLGHLWSLGVEEQFYLVWPVLLVSAQRRRHAGTADGTCAAGSARSCIRAEMAAGAAVRSGGGGVGSGTRRLAVSATPQSHHAVRCAAGRRGG
jgi:peptidoglycan/LPS O-acetylase OafA/YrhL